ncbi:hypothetical protein AB5I41_22920 [Sphingomonas sp. MMS24-JH45]
MLAPRAAVRVVMIRFALLAVLLLLPGAAASQRRGTPAVHTILDVGRPLGPGITCGRTTAGRRGRRGSSSTSASCGGCSSIAAAWRSGAPSSSWTARAADADRALPDFAEARRPLFEHLRQCADALHAAADVERVAIHGSTVEEDWVTHGCIGVPTAFAILYANARVGNEAIVTRNWLPGAYD